MPANVRLPVPVGELVEPLRAAAIAGGHTSGVLVVAIDLEGDDASQQVIVDDVSVVVAGTCFVAGVQNWPRAGTQVWTIKGRDGRGGSG
ncbi:MAG: hypothetical protein ACREXX_13935 [Gammaproteobacteria bacterium]